MNRIAALNLSTYETLEQLESHAAFVFGLDDLEAAHGAQALAEAGFIAGGDGELYSVDWHDADTREIFLGAANAFGTAYWADSEDDIRNRSRAQRGL